MKSEEVCIWYRPVILDVQLMIWLLLKLICYSIAVYNITASYHVKGHNYLGLKSIAQATIGDIITIYCQLMFFVQMDVSAGEDIESRM